MAPPMARQVLPPSTTPELSQEALDYVIQAIMNKLRPSSVDTTDMLDISVFESENEGKEKSIGSLVKDNRDKT